MRLRDRLLTELCTTRRGLAAFFGLGVADGSFFAIPIEPFVLPIMAANPRRVWTITATLLAGCIVGTYICYMIGLLAEEALVGPILANLGLTEQFAQQIDAIRDTSFWTLFIIGLTPIPLLIGTLGAGVAGVDPLTFGAAMVLSRGIRFGALGLLALAIGTAAAEYYDRWKGTLAAGAIATVAAGFVAVKLMDF